MRSDSRAIPVQFSLLEKRRQEIVARTSMSLIGSFVLIQGYRTRHFVEPVSEQGLDKLEILEQSGTVVRRTRKYKPLC